MECLRQGSNVSCISPEALDQIKSLTLLSDEAILSVRQARVLDGLRFELMNERLGDIEEAHMKTFDWLFHEEAVELRRTSSRASLVSRDLGSDDQTRPRTGSEEPHTEPSSSNDELHHSTKSRSTSHNNELSPSGSFHSRNSAVQIPGSTDRVEEEQNSLDDWGHVYESINAPRGDHSGDDNSFLWEIDSDPPEVDDGHSSSSVGDISMPSSRQLSIASIAPWQSRGAPWHGHGVSKALWQAMAETREIFITWLRKGSGIFHISGKPGSGKSTLMKYVCRHPQTEKHLRAWAGNEQLVTGQFFFWRPGSPLQRTLKGVLRGLLHCILQKSPDLIPTVFPQHWEASMYREKIYIEHHECQQGFEALDFTNATYKKHKFVFFIDGLDEFEGNPADLIRKFNGWTERTQNVKICVSSREWAVFNEGFQHCPKFRLHDLTRSDIQQFVEDRFKQMDLGALHSDSDNPSDDAATLQRQVVMKSDGVFLWVSLVIRHIEEGLTNGDLMDDLMGVVNTLPTELEPMLHQLLDSIPATNRKLAYALLSLASFCNRYDGGNTRSMQYSFLDEYVKDKNFAMHAEVKLLSPLENSRRLQRSQKRIYGTCKGFLELREQFSGTRPRIVEITNLHGPLVRFTHRSITEFIESPRFQRLLDRELPGFQPFDAWCQTYLGILQRLDLPKYYFAPSLRSQDRRTYLPATFRPWGKADTIVPPFWHRNVVSWGPPTPSYMYELSKRMMVILNLDLKGYLPRLWSFLDNVTHTIVNRGLRIARNFVVGARSHGTTVSYDLQDVVTLLSAAAGLHEYIRRKAGMKPQLIADCTFFCIYSLKAPARFSNGIRFNTGGVFKSLDALFGLGGLPETLLPLANYPVFLDVISTWCFNLSPRLDVIAFMLYHGTNPSFTIRLSKKRYEVRIKDRAMSVFKGYLETGYLMADSESGLQHVRIKAPGWSSLSSSIRYPGPPPMPSGRSNRSFRSSGIVATVSPALLSTMESNGQSLSLSDLLPVWFPKQGGVLQEVVDWLINLGMPVNQIHRLQLQSKYGHLLRPMFDVESPWLTSASKESSKEEWQRDNEEPPAWNGFRSDIDGDLIPLEGSESRYGIRLMESWSRPDGEIRLRDYLE